MSRATQVCFLNAIFTVTDTCLSDELPIKHSDLFDQEAFRGLLIFINRTEQIKGSLFWVFKHQLRDVILLQIAVKCASLYLVHYRSITSDARLTTGFSDSSSCSSCILRIYSTGTYASKRRTIPLSNDRCVYNVQDLKI